MRRVGNDIDNNSGGRDPLDLLGSALLFAVVLNDAVPGRLRLSDDAISSRLRRYETMPKRELLRMVYRAWREVGAQPTRGRVMPSLQVGVQSVELLWNAFQEIQAEVAGSPAQRDAQGPGQS